MVQGSSGSMSATKKDKHVKVRQVSCNKRLNTPWPVNYHVEAGANQFLLTCKLFQGSKIFSDKNNIVPEIVNGNIILDCQIKTKEGWATRLNFIWDRKSKKA